MQPNLRSEDLGTAFFVFVYVRTWRPVRTMRSDGRFSPWLLPAQSEPTVGNLARFDEDWTKATPPQADYIQMFRTEFTMR